MNVQRVTNDGIDFITKKGFASENFAKKTPVSILHTVGQYTPGEIVQQWRAEGVCESLELSEIINKASDYTVSNIIASTRTTTKEKMEEETEGLSSDEKLEAISEGRHPIQSSQFTEILQGTRNDLKDGKISLEEMNDSIKAFRFRPFRVELMVGGPDQVMWNRWEWQRSENGSDWYEPTHILPH